MSLQRHKGTKETKGEKSLTAEVAENAEETDRWAARHGLASSLQPPASSLKPEA